jgi:membrane-associated protease RseP (regulator of RpoE activity)
MDYPGPIVDRAHRPEPSWYPLPGEGLPARVPRPSWWYAYGRHALLFVLTAVSIWLTGGPLLVVGLMSIMLAHEMGHYVACRIYGVDATLPFFIPFPVLSLVGTLGAVIRIRSPFPNRRALFDIGIAGPIAGFVVCLPALVLGIREAQVIPTPAPSPTMLSLGDPLLLQWAAQWIKGDISDGHTLLFGPLGMAAWFGLLLTALNLIPVGQLDGGHVTYALFRGWALHISRLAYLSCLALLWFRPTWLVWSIVLFFLGRRHPPTLNDSAPLGLGRVFVAILGFAIFVVCFTPDPFVFTWADFLGGIGDLLRSIPLFR